LTRSAALEGLTHRTADLSVLNTQTQLVHAKEVVTTGVCIFARSQERIRAFEMQVHMEGVAVLVEVEPDADRSDGGVAGERLRDDRVTSSQPPPTSGAAGRR
jgi:hypothetical protein